MKKIINLCFVTILCMILVSCGGQCCKAIELMGAGDRIHDTYTFANTGVKIQQIDDTTFNISGSVEKLSDENIKNEFEIASDINHIVAIKLTAIDSKVDKNNVEITVDGIRAYDAQHLNGSDYTFILLEAGKGLTTTIKVKWNASDPEKVYTVKFSEDLILK